MLPQWSPDGTMISCAVWTRETWAGKLTVVYVATGRILVENSLTHGGNTKWSPDSRVIASSGAAYQGDNALLYTITVPDGKVTVIDSLDVLASHEFSWSPDGRWIAFARPTQLDHYESWTAAELWIADARTGESWCILDSPEWVESDPLWITNESIQVTRMRADDAEDTGDSEEHRLIVELRYQSN
jgi:Tol biopolymer transport system component